MVDLDTSKELLTYYIDNDLPWSIGSINEGNYTKIGLSVVPTFYFFNQTGHELKTVKGEMSYSQLLDFITFQTIIKNYGDEIKKCQL